MKETLGVILWFVSLVTVTYFGFNMLIDSNTIVKILGVLLFILFWKVSDKTESFTNFNNIFKRKS